MLDSAITEALKALLGPAGWRAPAEVPGVRADPRGRFHSRAGLVVLPLDADAVVILPLACMRWRRRAA